MAKKRKSTATVAAQESEPVQTTEPEPKPVEEPDVEDEDPMEQGEGHEGDGQEEADEEGGQSDPKDAASSEPGQKENPQIGDPKPNENGGDEDLAGETLESLLEPFSKDQLTLLIKEAVDRDPDFIKNVQKAADADPAHCKIFIHGLGWEANTETISNVFGKYGEIKDCKVVKDKSTGKSKGYGFILYKDRLGAKRALKEPQKIIDGRMASCQLASAGPVQNPAQQQQQQQKQNAVAMASTNQPTVSEYTQRKIYVSNVSADLDIKKLSEFFSKFGEIEEGPLGLDKQTGKPRGFCLFVYKSVDSAKRALEEPHKNFEGHMLHCQKAVDGPKHGKGFFNQPHGQGQPQQQPQQQGYYGHSAKKGRYAGSGGVGHAGGHLMAPSGPPMPSVGFNPAVAPALGQAVAALLATQGAGLGIGNLLGGIGPGVNPQGMMNNAGYGAQGGAYGGQPGMPGAYGGQAQIGQGGMRPHQGGAAGGAPYMGHGH